jgi:AraC-like DNA-binding protein
MTTDILSDLLRTVRLRFLQPDGCEAPADAVHMTVVTEGAAIATLAGEQPRRLEAGDLVMFPHGGGHVAPEPGARVLAGRFSYEMRPSEALLEALPAMLVLAAGWPGTWVTRMLGDAAREQQARAGLPTVIERLAETLYVSAVRHHLESLPAEDAGSLAGLRDRYVARALSLLHAEPAKRWTVDELGRQVGLSRSALHERFSAFLGQPPTQYLAQWRIRLGSKLLLQTRRPVAAIAEDVGYDSEASFCRAFKRQMGEPPATWRRSQAVG